MKLRTIRYIFLLAALCMLSCSRHSVHWETLAQVETFIEAQPDSALAALQRIDAQELAGKEERAKYALLLSMALDKNYVDKTDLEVLQPAIDYYQGHGTATDKLRTYYYQGRIYQNQQKHDELAMLCFVKAITEGATSDDILTMGTSVGYYATFVPCRLLYRLDCRSYPLGTKRLGGDMISGFNNSIVYEKK